jgi:glycosyltransferase involved in cell wall biosynthesis
VKEAPLLFSVVVPARNRPDTLAATLEALARQDLGPDGFEVVVVDDGSDPPLSEASLRPAAPLQLRIERVAHGGPGAARNTGARLARGRFVCFTDHDCRPDPDWLSQLERAFAVHPGAALGGRTENVEPRLGDVASAATNEAVFRFFTRDGAEPEFLPTSNLAFPADAFRELGGFHPGIPFAAEDRELCDRWRAAGRRLVHVSEAVVRHAHGLSLAGFLRQQFHYGQGALRYQRLRVRASARPLPPDPAFYLFLLSFPLRREGPSGAALTAAVCGGRAAYVVGWCVERIRWGAR